MNAVLIVVVAVLMAYIIAMVLFITFAPNIYFPSYPLVKPPKPPKHHRLSVEAHLIKHARMTDIINRYVPPSMREDALRELNKDDGR